MWWITRNQSSVTIVLHPFKITEFCYNYTSVFLFVSNARWRRPHWLPMQISRPWPEQVIATSKSVYVTVDVWICYNLRRGTCYQTAEAKGYERQAPRKKVQKWVDGQDPYRFIDLAVKLLPVCRGYIKQDVCVCGEEATALTCPSSLVIRKQLGLITRKILSIPSGTQLFLKKIISSAVSVWTLNLAVDGCV